MSTVAIRTENVTRSFKKKGQGESYALKDINISVNPGEIFGFLGPNGAGKTTLIKVLTTLLYPSSGRAFVAGYDVVKQAKKVRPLINMVSGGETSGYGILSVRENIWMFSQFYGIESKEAKRRIDYYLERFGLADDAKTKINKLSTGMRQKMNIIRGLVTDPQILFLDEPTLGLDVHIARQVRDFMKEWIQKHPEKTIFLTTHYMAEAEQLCDRVAIIDRGQIVECGSTENMRNKAGGESIYRLTISPPATSLDFFKQIDGVKEPYLGAENGSEEKVEIRFGLTEDDAISEVLSAVKQNGHKVIRFSKQEVSMEDLFMKIVGRKLEKGE